jgi:hypothetical protein
VKAQPDLYWLVTVVRLNLELKNSDLSNLKEKVGLKEILII